MLDFLLMKVWGPTAPHSPLLYKRASPHRALVLILSEHEPCGTGYLYSSVVCTHHDHSPSRCMSYDNITCMSYVHSQCIMSNRARVREI